MKIFLSLLMIPKQQFQENILCGLLDETILNYLNKNAPEQRTELKTK